MQPGDLTDTWMYLHKSSNICGMCLTNVLNPETQKNMHYFQYSFSEQIFDSIKVVDSFS